MFFYNRLLFLKLLAVPNGAVSIIFFSIMKVLFNDLKGQCKFSNSTIPVGSYESKFATRLDYLVQNFPPTPPPHLVHLRIAPIRLSIKIIMLQRKYKNDIRMQECHRRNIRFDFEFKSTLLHLSAWILAALFGVQYLWNIGSYNALYNFPPKWNQSIFSI